MQSKGTAHSSLIRTLNRNTWPKLPVHVTLYITTATARRRCIGLRQFRTCHFKPGISNSRKKNSRCKTKTRSTDYKSGKLYTDSLVHTTHITDLNALLSGISGMLVRDI